MAFIWDPEKSKKNKANPHRLKGFEEAVQLWTNDFEEIPLNVNSGEQVYLMAGEIDDVVWGAMYVKRGDEIRILSFRKLNERERAKYGFE